MPSFDRARGQQAWPVWLGLSSAPIAVGSAALAAPFVRVGDAAADTIAFAGAALTAMISIAIAVSGDVPRSARYITLFAAAVTLAALAAFGGTTSRAAAVLGNAALVALAWAIGVSIGRQIQHPGHLFPACVVVACADLSSIVSRYGPTHAIAESEKALSLLAVSFPVPGTTAWAPALGAGDLVFIALVLAAVRVHALPFVRATCLCLLGTAIAATASALLRTAVPALVPIAAAVVIGLPAVRELRAQDRRVAFWAMAIAVSLAAAIVATRLVPGQAVISISSPQAGSPSRHPAIHCRNAAALS